MLTEEQVVLQKENVEAFNVDLTKMITECMNNAFQTNTIKPNTPDEGMVARWDLVKCFKNEDGVVTTPQIPIVVYIIKQDSRYYVRVVSELPKSVKVSVDMQMNMLKANHDYINTRWVVTKNNTYQLISDSVEIADVDGIEQGEVFEFANPNTVPNLVFSVGNYMGQWCSNHNLKPF